MPGRGVGRADDEVRWWPVTELRGRIGRLERVMRAARRAERPDATEARERFAASIVALVDRVRGTPSPPPDRQSAAERIVRAALADAEAAEGHEYLHRFWQGVTAR